MNPVSAQLQRIPFESIIGKDYVQTLHQAVGQNDIIGRILSGTHQQNPQQQLESIEQIIINLTQKLASFEAQHTKQTTPPQLNSVFPQNTAYSSTPAAEMQFVSVPNAPGYILGHLPTRPVVGELMQQKLANIFNPAYRAELQSAIETNGGLGNAEDGFLALSKNGFVRLNNAGLSAEQNQMLALISLQTGIAIEKLPSRTSDSNENPNINHWVNEFIQKHDVAWKGFLENPAAGYLVKDGRKCFLMQQVPNSELVASYDYKSRGGLGGLLEKGIKWIKPVVEPIIEAVKLVGGFIPGVGTAVSAVAAGVESALNIIQSGKLKVSDLLSSAKSALAGLIPGGNSVFGKILSGALDIGVDYLETGKVKAKDVLKTAGSFVKEVFPEISRKFGNILG